MKGERGFPVRPVDSQRLMTLSQSFPLRRVVTARKETLVHQGPQAAVRSQMAHPDHRKLCFLIVGTFPPCLSFAVVSPACLDFLEQR